MSETNGRVAIKALAFGTAYITAKCGDESEKVKVVVAEFGPRRKKSYKDVTR